MGDLASWRQPRKYDAVSSFFYCTPRILYHHTAHTSRGGEKLRETRRWAGHQKYGRQQRSFERAWVGVGVGVASDSSGGTAKATDGRTDEGCSTPDAPPPPHRTGRKREKGEGGVGALGVFVRLTENSVARSHSPLLPHPFLPSFLSNRPSPSQFVVLPLVRTHVS